MMTPRLRQICLAAPTLEPLVGDIAAIFGIAVCHRDPEVALFGLENALLVAGHDFIEVVAPTRPDTAAGRFLTRSQGQGGYMAIFDGADPRAIAARAEAMGVATAFTIDRPGQYLGVQLHPRDCRAAMLEFDHNLGGEALGGVWWPAGGDGWQRHVDTGLTTGIAGITVATPDPAGLAAHWGAIIGCPVAPGPALALNHGHIAFTADPGRERLDALTMTVTDADRVRAEAARRGRLDADGSIRMGGVTFHLA